MKIRGTDEVSKNLQALDQKVKHRAGVIMGYVGAATVTQAKRGAPWTDRTGNARRSIHSETTANGANIAVSVGIGVHYGVYLELDHGGKYRVVDPTVFGYGKSQMQVLLGSLLS
nr:MAG TPA: type I neck protein [Caudoviricetes sp.]